MKASDNMFSFNKLIKAFLNLFLTYKKLVLLRFIVIRMKSNESTINSNVETSNSSKIIVNPTVPIEELLGSVTTYNNVEGSESKSLQLRTSARVFKKMKLDSANAVVTIPEKKGIRVALVFATRK